MVILEKSKSNFFKLCDNIKKGKVILWVGAGFSAYAGYLTGEQLSSHLKKVIWDEFREEIYSTNLSDVASLYILKKGRVEIEKELCKIYSSPPINTNIHEALSRIRYFPYIITTNYDQLFELSYEDKLYVVSDENLLPNTPKDSNNAVLLKIHGDITNPKKMVISTEDYQSFDKNSHLWNKISSIFAEYSILFMGYSVKDVNVLKLLNIVMHRLGVHKNPYYLISRSIITEKHTFLDERNILEIEMSNADAITQIFQYVTNNSLIRMGTDITEIPKIEPIFKNLGIQVCYSVNGKYCEQLSINPIKRENLIKIDGKINFQADNKEEIEQLLSCIKRETVSPVTISRDSGNIDFSVSIKDINLIDIKNDSEYVLDNITFTPHPTDLKVVDISTKNHSNRITNCNYEYFEGKKECVISISHSSLKIKFVCQKHERSKVNITISPPETATSGSSVYNLISNWIKGDPLIVIPLNSEEVRLMPSPNSINKREINIIDFYQNYFKKLCFIEEKLKLKFKIPESFDYSEYKMLELIYQILNGNSQEIKEFKMNAQELQTIHFMKKF